MVYLTRKAEFSASHYYHNPEFTPEENQRIFGKCNNPHGHGHNYAVEVTVGGPVDTATGMICNLADLDQFVKKNILERFGHENLNTLTEFEGVVPTTENLCVRLFDILEQGFPHARIEKIRVEETMLNSFEYAGGKEIKI